LDPLGTAATNRPIVPAPGDYDDEEIGGMMIGRVNRSTRRKLAPVPTCCPDANPGRRGTDNLGRCNVIYIMLLKSTSISHDILSTILFMRT
jgi:hypothetical protein